MAYYQQNALSIASRKILAELFAQLINTNDVIQSYREILASIPSFDSLQLFRFLDSEQKGFLTEKDLQNILVTDHKKLLTYAFSWVDIRKVGQVSRFQFSTFLLPRENLQLRQITMQNLQHQPTNKEKLHTLSTQVIQFQKLITELMKKEMKLIELRHQLLKSKDYSLFGCRFAFVDSDRSWICCQDLVKFLRNFGFQTTLRQIQSLIESINNDGEGKLAFSQLQWIVEGLENKSKVYRQRIKQSNKKKPLKKPNIQENKFKQYLKTKNMSSYSRQKEFDSLVTRMKQIERQQSKKEKRLIQQERKSYYSARKSCQEEIISLQLQRQKESVRKEMQRKKAQAQQQLKLQLDNLLVKTISLQKQSDRLVRLQNRMDILDDSMSINNQIHNLVNKDYKQVRGSSIKRHLKESYYLSSLPFQSQMNRLTIQNHVKASDKYLDYAKQAQIKIMQERRQKANKQNLMGGYLNKKTPGTLINKIKNIQSIDSKFQSIRQLP